MKLNSKKTAAILVMFGLGIFYQIYRVLEEESLEVTKFREGESVEFKAEDTSKVYLWYYYGYTKGESTNGEGDSMKLPFGYEFSVTNDKGEPIQIKEGFKLNVQNYENSRRSIYYFDAEENSKYLVKVLGISSDYIFGVGPSNMIKKISFLFIGGPLGILLVVVGTIIWLVDIYCKKQRIPNKAHNQVVNTGGATDS